MDDMIERVAKAMYDADKTIIFQTKDGFVFLDWDEAGVFKDGAKEKAKLLKLARAAIEALRNPPEFVLDAMNPSGRYASIVVVEAWNDAIDAILSNTKEGG